MLEKTTSDTPAELHLDTRDGAVGRLLGGRYELQALVGSGASAQVYLAQDRSLGRQVAVKCLRAGLNEDERFRRRFRAEAQAAAKLGHPNLLSVYDWGEDPNAYLVTELLLGGTLRDLLARSPRLSPSQGLLIALQVAQGLQYAHSFGIVHRDIKPANLLFGEEGRLRIADFGIARAVAEAAWTEQEGVLVGTARYAAPEQALGDAIDEKTDVYSLALTVIEAVTGRVPLLRENALATMVLRQDRDVVDIEELGPLGPALLPAGRADPEARPTAGELIEALTETARLLPRPVRLPLVNPIQDTTTNGTGGVSPEMDSDLIDLAGTEETDLHFRPEAHDEADAETAPTFSDTTPGAFDGDQFRERRTSVEAQPLSVVDLRRQSERRSGEIAAEVLEVQPIPRPSPTPRGPSSQVRTRVSGQSEPAGSDDQAPAGSQRQHFPDEAATATEPSAEAITRFDLPLADGHERPQPIDVRDEVRGRFGDTGQHSVFDASKGPTTLGSTAQGLVGESRPTSDDPAGMDYGRDNDHGPLGDGFDDLTIGELVIVDPEQIDGPPVAHPRPTSELGAVDLPNPGQELPLDPDSPFPVRMARVASGPFDPTREPIPNSRSKAFQTAFVDVQDDHAPRGENSLIQRWAAPALIGLVALLIVAAAIIALVSTRVLSGSTDSDAAQSLSATVGNYLGLTVPEARADAEANGWELTVSERREDGTQAGVITRQLPAAGDVLGSGSTLVVEVSLGAELRTLPRVVGLTVDEAAAVLQRSNLRLGLVTEQNNQEVEPGRVLAARVEGAVDAEQIESGTAVDLVVSAGPEAVAMPSFVGLNLDTALAQAEQLGLVVTQAEAPSATYDAGFVVDTTPPTNTPVVAGDQLTLVISTGAPFIEVPNVVGMSPAEAADALVEAGFAVTDTDGPPNQPVIGTSPDAGASVRKGNEVLIRTGADSE